MSLMKVTLSRLDISLYTRPKSVIAICYAARSFPPLLVSYLVRNLSGHCFSEQYLGNDMKLHLSMIVLLMLPRTMYPCLSRYGNVSVYVAGQLGTFLPLIHILLAMRLSRSMIHFDLSAKHVYHTLKIQYYHNLLSIILYMIYATRNPTSHQLIGFEIH